MGREPLPALVRRGDVGEAAVGLQLRPLRRRYRLTGAGGSV